MLRRINSARELRKLAQELGMSMDWHEPDEQQVTVRIEGEHFDNCGSWPAAEVQRRGMSDWTGEFCVVICQAGKDIAVVNLASLMAMASFPDGPLGGWPEPDLQQHEVEPDVTCLSIPWWG